MSLWKRGLPGEEFFQGQNANGFDFYSGHLHYHDQGLVRDVVLGDYQIQFGQGVTAWSGLGLGKSSYVMNVKRSGRGIRPYTSVDENRFMRGAAFTLGKGDWTATGFYSSKGIDANVVEPDSLSNPDQQQISSFQLSGLHRTADELFDADAIRELLQRQKAWRAKRNVQAHANDDVVWPVLAT